MKNITKRILRETVNAESSFLKRSAYKIASKLHNLRYIEFDNLRDILENRPSIQNERHLFLFEPLVYGICDFEVALSNSKCGLTDISDYSIGGEMKAYFHEKAMDMNGRAERLERFIFLGFLDPDIIDIIDATPRKGGGGKYFNPKDKGYGKPIDLRRIVVPEDLKSLYVAS